MGNTKHIAFSGETTSGAAFTFERLELEAHTREISVTVYPDPVGFVGRQVVIGHVRTDAIGGGNRLLRFLEAYLDVGRVWFTDLDMPWIVMCHRNSPKGPWELWDLTAGVVNAPPLVSRRLP